MRFYRVRFAGECTRIKLSRIDSIKLSRGSLWSFRMLKLASTVEIKSFTKGGREEEKEEKEEEKKGGGAGRRWGGADTVTGDVVHVLEYTAEISRRKDRQNGYLDMRSHEHPVWRASRPHRASCQWEVRYQRARGVRFILPFSSSQLPAFVSLRSRSRTVSSGATWFFNECESPDKWVAEINLEFVGTGSGIYIVTLFIKEKTEWNNVILIWFRWEQNVGETIDRTWRPGVYKW